ncbi:MAG TPA: RbsD/FucU domain-containing protein [Magnetospirillaceae bacterium]|jgi:L-fucose mutarotase
MLRGIPPVLNGDLLKILRDMGHADELVISDANYPSASTSQRLVRTDGISMTDALSAILEIFPLDDFVDSPVFLMSPGPGKVPPLLGPVQKIVDKAHGKKVKIAPVPRFDFYDQARQAYACVATNERRLYGDIIIKKGILRPGEK